MEGQPKWITCLDAPQYEVAMSGVIRHRKTKETTTQTPNKKGYYRINIWKNKKMAWLSVHRIVGKAYILNPDNKAQIDHIDGDPANNSVENLRWATRSENNSAKSKYLFKNGRAVSTPYISVSAVVQKTKTRYRSAFIHGGTRHELGYFDNSIDAAKKYNEYIVEKGFDKWRPLNKV